MKARIFLSVVIALAAFWIVRRPAPTPEPEIEAITSKPAPLSNPASPVKAETKFTTVPKSQNADAPKPTDPGVVRFEVKEGLAVAFGDVILGTPEDETVDEGYFKIPTPQYWDKPEIPFVIDAKLPHPERVKASLRHIEQATGVKFVAYDSQPDAIVFQPGKEHCLSVLGRHGGLQPIRISEDCGWHEITHEVMHAIGFIHEQSRADRDSFVEVLWSNIEEPYKAQFEKLSDEFSGPARGTEFDYQSIMLYSPTLFARVKGDTTLKSRTPSAIRPSRNGMSPEDIRRVKRHFNLD